MTFYDSESDMAKVAINMIASGECTHVEVTLGIDRSGFEVKEITDSLRNIARSLLEAEISIVSIPHSSGGKSIKLKVVPLQSI